MAVAFDAQSAPAGGGGAGNQSWTHTPAGTPRGVLVVAAGIAGVDNITGCTYGGVNVPEVPLSPVVKSTGEAGSAHAFFLGSGVLSGAQTVLVTNTGSSILCRCYTFTAAGDMEVIDTASFSSDSVTDPSDVLALLGREAAAVVAFISGAQNVAGITPFTGWTSDFEADAGTIAAGVYSYDTIGTADITAGWTQPAEDATGIAVAVGEVAGSVSLIVADAAHGQTADSPALEQGHVLAVQDATHGHAAESPTLSQAVDLTVADAAHAHTAESVALTQANELAVADAAHAQAADAVALTQANILAPDDALHAHSAESPVLTIAGALAVADALHAHAAEAPALVQANVLAVLDALHGHTADSPTLSEAQLLVVADALHAHAAESPTIAFGALLAVADALHAHASDGVALTQANVLAVLDALHAHTADVVLIIDESIPASFIGTPGARSLTGSPGSRTLTATPGARSLVGTPIRRA